MGLAKCFWGSFGSETQAILETMFYERVSLRPSSNGEEVRDIQHKWGWYQTQGFIFDSLWHFITKCKRYYYKIPQKFITKCIRFLITKCNVYYKLRQYSTCNSSCENSSLLFFFLKLSFVCILKKVLAIIGKSKCFQNADAEDHHPLTTVTGSVNISLDNDDDDAYHVRWGF